MEKRKSVNRWVVVAVTGIGATLLVLMVVLTLSRESSEAPAPSATPVPTTPPSPVIAAVNGEPIDHNFWLEMVLMDQVMSGLAGLPAPSPEETLERLINEMLVLQAAPSEWTPTDQEVEAAIADLEANWGVGDTQVVEALEEAGLGREGLERTVARLLTVQRGEQALATEETPIGEWLSQERARAEIVVYEEFAAVSNPPGPSPEPASSGELGVGSFAPDFALGTPDGDWVTLSNYRGQPVLLTFCASWSEPCSEELRLVQTLVNRHQAQDLETLVVDVRDEPEAALALAREAGYAGPLLLDHDGRVAKRFLQIQGVPASLILDREGRILYRAIGPLDAEEVEQTLASLVQSSSTQSPTPELGIAPDFTLDQAGGGVFTLSDQLAHGSVVLIFFQRCG
ncbi:MAG: redoxin domain-containing protein [Anaerolineae bacterium]|jgi:peroxiredoxin